MLQFYLVIKLALLDDNVKLISDLRLEMQEYPDFDWIVTASSALKYVQNLKANRAIPDVVLMDISMTTADEGIVATRYLHQHYPDVKVVMFSISDNDEQIFEAFKAGAVGYLLKNEKPSVIRKTIVDVSTGGAFMSPGIAMKAIRFMASVSPHATVKEQVTLSQREREILQLIAQGFTYQAVADQLTISYETVKKHMANIFKKLQVTNKTEAINKARMRLH